MDVRRGSSCSLVRMRPWRRQQFDDATCIDHLAAGCLRRHVGLGLLRPRANADCAGAIVGTVTQSADASATYTGTVDASITPAPVAAAIPVKVDKLTANLPAHTLSVTGSGVTHTTGQWCIAYANGTSTCIKDEGTYPAQNGVAGGLALQGNTLYDLTANGASWVVDGVFTKK